MSLLRVVEFKAEHFDDGDLKVLGGEAWRAFQVAHGSADSLSWDSRFWRRGLARDLHVELRKDDDVGFGPDIYAVVEVEVLDRGTFDLIDLRRTVRSTDPGTGDVFVLVLTARCDPHLEPIIYAIQSVGAWFRPSVPVAAKFLDALAREVLAPCRPSRPDLAVRDAEFELASGRLHPLRRSCRFYGTPQTTQVHVPCRGSVLAAWDRDEGHFNLGVLGRDDTGLLRDPGWRPTWAPGDALTPITEALAPSLLEAIEFGR